MHLYTEGLHDFVLSRHPYILTLSHRYYQKNINTTINTEELPYTQMDYHIHIGTTLFTDVLPYTHRYYPIHRCPTIYT